MRSLAVLPISFSAWEADIDENSVEKKDLSDLVFVSRSSRLSNMRSTAHGWYFVSLGDGGMTSVLRRNDISNHLY